MDLNIQQLGAEAFSLGFVNIWIFSILQLKKYLMKWM